MPSTTTSTTTARLYSTAQIRSRGYPADYDLHYSNANSNSNSIASSGGRRDDRLTTPAPGNTTQPAALQKPPGWTNDYRRVPSYQPVNRALDQSQRRVYTSFPERVFIAVMFTVATNAVRSRPIIMFHLVTTSVCCS